MAKKAKKVSWRTLARQAEKVAGKNLPKARRLRAKSAALRRAARAAVLKAVKLTPAPITRRKPLRHRDLGAGKRATKGWATRRANAITEAAANLGPRSLADARGVQQETAQGLNAEYRPGRGELVGGVDAQTAERIVKLARKKGGTDAVQNEVMSLRQIAHCDGSNAADRRATERLIQVQQIIADRIVCGFVAEVDARQRNGLAPADTFTLNSFTIVKIVDALNKAGYKGTGKS